MSVYRFVGPITNKSLVYCYRSSVVGRRVVGRRFVVGRTRVRPFDIGRRVAGHRGRQRDPRGAGRTTPVSGSLGSVRVCWVRSVGCGAPNRYPSIAKEPLPGLNIVGGLDVCVVDHCRPLCRVSCWRLMAPSARRRSRRRRQSSPVPGLPPESSSWIDVVGPSGVPAWASSRGERPTRWIAVRCGYRARSGRLGCCGCCAVRCRVVPCAVSRLCVVALFRSRWVFLRLVGGG